MLTKLIEVGTDEMRVNFATSAAGGMTVSVCNAEGCELEGYTSYEMFGDSVDRPVEFEKPLAELFGRSVRFKFKLKDAHLYSFMI